MNIVFIGFKCIRIALFWMIFVLSRARITWNTKSSWRPKGEKTILLCWKEIRCHGKMVPPDSHMLAVDGTRRSKTVTWRIDEDGFLDCWLSASEGDTFTWFCLWRVYGSVTMSLAIQDAGAYMLGNFCDEILEGVSICRAHTPTPDCWHAGVNRSADYIDGGDEMHSPWINRHRTGIDTWGLKVSLCTDGM